MKSNSELPDATFATKFDLRCQSEYLAASKDLSDRTPEVSILNFFRRIDEALAVAKTDTHSPPVCAKSCSFCCFLKVQVSALEAIMIARYVSESFKPHKIREVVQRAQANALEVKGLSQDEHSALNQQCAFLDDGTCSIYSVRPSECRKYHSVDIEVCRATYEQPSNLNIPAAYSIEVAEAGQGTKVGFEAATKFAGFDQREYEINSAFLEAMRVPNLSVRLQSGKKTLKTAKVIDP